VHANSTSVVIIVHLLLVIAVELRTKPTLFENKKGA